MPLSIQRIDTRAPDAPVVIAQLRGQLAPEGNVVSAAGRAKTIDVFVGTHKNQMVTTSMGGSFMHSGGGVTSA